MFSLKKIALKGLMLSKQIELIPILLADMQPGEGWPVRYALMPMKRKATGTPGVSGPVSQRLRLSNQIKRAGPYLIGEGWICCSCIATSTFI